MWSCCDASVRRWCLTARTSTARLRRDRWLRRGGSGFRRRGSFSRGRTPTSRGRIKDHYDYYLVWNQWMRDELLSTTLALRRSRSRHGNAAVRFHARPEFRMTRGRNLPSHGAGSGSAVYPLHDGGRQPFSGRAPHGGVCRTAYDGTQARAQLLVRTYIKGTSAEMMELAGRKLPNVVFPPVMWKADALTPMYEDISIYNSLLQHCSLGINVASTVSLELMMYDKPVINLGFDPPGAQLVRWSRFERHLRLDHYGPVAGSGAVMVARSTADLERMIRDGLRDPGRQSNDRRRFLKRDVRRHAGRLLRGENNGTAAIAGEKGLMSTACSIAPNRGLPRRAALRAPSGDGADR